jgi:hypothetical protein
VHASDHEQGLLEVLAFLRALGRLETCRRPSQVSSLLQCTLLLAHASVRRCPAARPALRRGSRSQSACLPPPRLPRSAADPAKGRVGLVYALTLSTWRAPGGGRAAAGARRLRARVQGPLEGRGGRGQGGRAQRVRRRRGHRGGRGAARGARVAAEHQPLAPQCAPAPCSTLEAGAWSRRREAAGHGAQLPPAPVSPPQCAQSRSPASVCVSVPRPPVHLAPDVRAGMCSRQPLATLAAPHPSAQRCPWPPARPQWSSVTFPAALRWLALRLMRVSASAGARRQTWCLRTRSVPSAWARAATRAGVSRRPRRPAARHRAAARAHRRRRPRPLSSRRRRRRSQRCWRRGCSWVRSGSNAHRACRDAACVLLALRAAVRGCAGTAAPLRQQRTLLSFARVRLPRR